MRLTGDEVREIVWNCWVEAETKDPLVGKVLGELLDEIDRVDESKV